MNHENYRSETGRANHNITPGVYDRLRPGSRGDHSTTRPRSVAGPRSAGSRNSAACPVPHSRITADSVIRRTVGHD